MANDVYRTVVKLKKQAQRAGRSTPDPVADLVSQINLTIQSDADPYLLIGALAEGAVQTLAQRIPAERQQHTSAALVQIILDRMRGSNIR